MKFVWVPSTKRYRRTEGEVKRERLKYEVVEFEIDKDSLIDRFNGYEERIEALEAQLAGGSQIGAADDFESNPEAYDAKAAEMTPTAPPPTTPTTDEADTRRKLALALRGMEIEAIEEKIEEAKPAALARYLSCTVSRLGELGIEGWQAFQSLRSMAGDPEGTTTGKRGRKFIPGSEERGLRYLALAQIAELNGAPAE